MSGARRRTTNRRTLQSFIPLRVAQCRPLVIQSMYYLYLILCADKSIYTGVTNNLARRFIEHQTKSGGWHTKLHKATKFLYTEKYHTREEALEREKQLKGWTRAKKEALIAEDKELLKKL